jgi:hypothetical protein
MKKLVVILIGFLVLSFSPSSKIDYSLEGKKIYLKITKETTEFKLQKVVKKFRKKNIIVNFYGSKFYDDGTIKKMTLRIDCNDGFSGSVEISDVDLKTGSFGFFRDYNENAKAPFNIGKI